MKRKLTALILAALCAVTSAVCLTACNSTPEATTPPPAGSEEEEPKEEEKPSEPELTFSDFIKDHKTDAVKFFEDYIYNSVVGEREVKAENWYLNDADGDDKVESASMSFIYNVNETERAVQVANVTFNPVDVQDIVDGKVTSVNTTVSREDVFTFDAKENYQNQDLATALYNAGNVNSDTMLFKVAPHPNKNYTQYEIVNMKDSGIEVTYVAAKNGDTKEDYFENLAKNPIVVAKSETTLEGVTLYSTGYTLEEFKEDEKPDPGPGPIVSDVTNAEIISALTENCIEAIVDATRIGGLKQDKQNIVDGTWYLTKDNNGNVTKAEYAYNYQKNSTDAYYVITEIEFASPLSSQNIKDGNIEVSNCINKYNNTASYNPTIQAERADLANAICDKAFGENENATRYIIDAGGGDDNNLGLTNAFTVIQIKNGNVKEATIIVKNDDSTIASYIANVNNGKHKDITYGKSYQISGEKVTAE